MTRANNRVDGNFMVSHNFRLCDARMRRAPAYTRAAVVFPTRGNARVREGDAEKCACGANGGECNATRAEPAAECSSEPNSEVASRLSATVPRNKNEGWREEGREAPVVSSVLPPPSTLPARPFIIADAKRDVEARRRYDPSSRSIWDTEDILLFFSTRTIQVVGVQNARYLKTYPRYKEKSLIVKCFMLLTEAASFL